ncbi:hypothetical protein IFM89_011086 [Coptis chinensis]|uniref:Uncharacterized protein n=1 Tax=Coptis chinensis TaxID=261450 RepID=A0A835ME21_9MAGN|nr:hypothetical protein IFM89_011086 [Coptis chinensis]
MDNLDKLRSELKLLEKERSDQASYMISLETELRQSEVELKSAKEESILLNHELDMLRSEILEAKSDIDEISGKEFAAQKAEGADQVAPSSPHVTSHLIDYSDTGHKLHGLKTNLEAAEFEIRELKSVAKTA